MSNELVIGGLLALVGLGSRRAQPQAYVDGQPVDVRLVDVGGGRLLRWDAADAWKAMVAAAAAAGVTLHLNSAFRSWDQQAALRALYEAGQGAFAAAPGHSDHQGGIAVDIETEGGSNAAFQWLNLNAKRFGFRRTVPSEPWHWEFA